MVLVFLSGLQGQVPRGLLCLLFDDHDRLVGHGRDGTWPGYGRYLCEVSLALVTAENAMEKERRFMKNDDSENFKAVASSSVGQQRGSRGLSKSPVPCATSWLLSTATDEGKSPGPERLFDGRKYDRREKGELVMLRRG